MDNEKLNEKLARWVFPAALEFDIKEGHIWVITDEGTAAIDDYFTSSLDACFKWLVPEAIKKIVADSECDIKLACGLLFRWWLEKLDPTQPALSLCLAIERLIEAENEEST